MDYESFDITIEKVSRKFSFRPGTSDEGVVNQIFIQEDYSLVRLKRFDDLAKFAERQIRCEQAPLIVDAGANIGASSVYFALKYPLAKIVAIEPSLENFFLLSTNSKGLQIEPSLGGIASKPGSLNVIDVGSGFWGLRTEAAVTGEFGNHVPAITIDSIYQEHKKGYFPFIVKIDIEGGEKELFSQNLDWVSKTPCIIIELHDWLLPEGGTSQPFLQCISKLDRDFIHIGENIFSIANNLDQFYDNSLGLTPSDQKGRIERFIERAEIQLASNQLDQAAQTYYAALALDPNHPECLLRLSSVLLQTKCYGDSFHHARHFLRMVSNVGFGYFLAGYAARELGRWHDSRSYLLRAVELEPSNLYARVLCCMSGFTVCMNQAEVASILRTYAEELDHLISDTALDTAAQIDNAVEGIGALTPFFLPYLGSDVITLQAKYGAWICAVMAAKYPHFSHPLLPRSAAGKIKIGIISHYFHNHSNWKIPIKGWLEQLDRRLFSIHCFYTGDINDAATESARSLADSFQQNNDVGTLAADLYEQQFDVLIYPGLGMDAVTLALAALRLAPAQCASWGHPVTTGMPTVDFYLSSDLMEPPDGSGHYTEKLVRLPNLSIWYDPPEAGDCSDFAIDGLGQDEVRFLCCQNLLKYLPQYDFVFSAIAAEVKNARFIFIANHISELTDKFMLRLDQAFHKRGMTAAKYVSFVPSLNSADFAALNASVDIFLDSIGWSGCNTVFESLPYNKPVVTLPGSFMRGRHAFAILKMMGIEDTIATSVDDYVSIAVRLANDRQWREDISARVLRNKHRVYKDRECIAGLEKFLMDVSGR